MGTTYIGNISAGGLFTDISGGLTTIRNIRIGARFVGVTSVDIAGDLPGWSAHTVVGFASYTIDSSLTLSSGFGTMTTRQTDSSISGTGAVYEAGTERAGRSWQEVQAQLRGRKP